MASGTFAQLNEQYPLLVDNQLVQFNQQLLLGRITTLMDSYKKLVLLYHTLGSSQYQTVKTVSKSVEEIVADFKEAYTEAEAIIESYDVMRQQNVAFPTCN